MELASLLGLMEKEATVNFRFIINNHSATN